jgi:EEF1A N-terminal glycine/lysine methyltransferase
VGIASTLAGASHVTISDYPAPELLATVEDNVKDNIPSSLQDRVAVQGHEWGDLSGSFSSAGEHGFTRIIAADCLWMPWQHQNLIRSMLHFLSDDEKARVWVVAGFHTGRAAVASFFDVAEDEGLHGEDIWEVDVDFHERPWARERDGEDITGQKRWLVAAALRRVPIQTRS